MPPDTSSASQADAHAALLNELKVDKAIVVGISAGARSAAELAIRHPERVTALILIVPGTYAPTSPVALEGSRTSALVLWLVNTGADFAWWAAEKVAPSILIRFIGVPPQLFSSSREAEQNRVVRIVRDIKPLSWRFSGINIDSNPARSVRPFSSAAVLSALGLEPLAPFPLPSPARFSRSVPEPDRASCCLHAGCRSGSIRTSPELIPEEGSPPVLASPNLLSTLQKQLD